VAGIVVIFIQSSHVLLLVLLRKPTVSFRTNFSNPHK
jgi:hypothetical protein